MRDYSNHIESVPGKRSGQACVKGTRIAVKDVVDWIASGLSVEAIISDFPELTAESIKSCVDYSNDNEPKS